MPSRNPPARVIPIGDGLARRHVSICVPFFNEADSLPELVQALDDYVRAAAARWPVRIDAIFVDDGSSDGGGQALIALAERHALAFDIRILRLSRNFGKEVALSAALEAARGDAVVLMDADLQHPVELLDQFFEGWLNEGYDVVYAYQAAANRPLALWHRTGRRLFYGLINASSDVPIPHDAGDFRLLSRRAYEALRTLGERQRLMKGLYSWIGFRQKGIVFTPPPRRAGKSNYSAIKLSLLAIEGVTSFSLAPLRMAVWVGVLLAVLSGGYGVWTIFEKIYLGIRVPGYPTLIVLIALIGAFQLIFLGVIGEYLGKVLMEVKGRPLFVLESDERRPGSGLPAAAEES